MVDLRDHDEKEKAAIMQTLLENSEITSIIDVASYEFITAGPLTNISPFGHFTDFYLGNGFVIVPVFEGFDMKAIKQFYTKLFPKRKVLFFDDSSLKLIDMSIREVLVPIPSVVEKES
jgi:agmatine/peptidylarginine deiminase